MLFLVQSAHLARPTTTDAGSPDAAFATAIAISTAQTPRRGLAAAMFGSLLLLRCMDDVSMTRNGRQCMAFIGAAAMVTQLEMTRSSTDDLMRWAPIILAPNLQIAI
jgi:hypothetical protein